MRWCGSCQQWHYLEMPLDRYVNMLPAMINDGRFSHMGHAFLRLEVQTAWGVWLRINHWDSSQGRRARLRVGVLYHMGNRTLTFHGTASVVSQLLLLLFQDWTFATLAFLPFVSQNNATTLPIHSPVGVAPARENAPLGVNWSVQSPPSVSHCNASTTHSATQLLPLREAPPVGATSPPPPGPRSHRWQGFKNSPLLSADWCFSLKHCRLKFAAWQQPRFALLLHPPILGQCGLTKLLLVPPPHLCTHRRLLRHLLTGRLTTVHLAISLRPLLHTHHQLFETASLVCVAVVAHLSRHCAPRVIVTPIATAAVVPTTAPLAVTRNPVPHVNHSARPAPKFSTSPHHWFLTVLAVRPAAVLSAIVVVEWVSVPVTAGVRVAVADVRQFAGA